MLFYFLYFVIMGHKIMKNYNSMDEILDFIRFVVRDAKDEGGVDLLKDFQYICEIPPTPFYYELRATLRDIIKYKRLLKYHNEFKQILDILDDMLK